MTYNNNMNITDEEQQSGITQEQFGDDMPYQKQRHRRRRGDRGKFFVLRNILNIIFIIGAIIGMVVYFFKNEEAGIIIVLGAMAFKMCECVIRLVK